MDTKEALEVFIQEDLNYIALVVEAMYRGPSLSTVSQYVDTL